jgi:hypothetical protein
MSINFQELLKQADQAGFTLIPDGMQDVVVEKAESVTASTGKPMIKVTYVVESGPHARRKLFNQHVLSPDNDNALKFFFEAMQAYGLGREYWATPGASLDAAAPAIVGRRVKVDVGHKEWPAGSGSMRNEVKKVYPQTSAPGAVVPGPGPVAAAPVVQPGPAAAVPQPGPIVAAAPAVVIPPVQQPVAQPQPAAQPPTPIVTPGGVPGPGDEEPF